MGGYTIQNGDTLWDLAREYGSSVDELAGINNISDPSRIYTGDTLEIPGYGNDSEPSSDSDSGSSADYNATDTTNPAYEQNEPTYNQSQAVTDAAAKLADFENNKPADYQSNYSTQIDDLLSKILNREDFSYDFNADPLYQQYKDQYTQQGNTAMRDTMGEAAALSGGYGNSYATTAGSQAYQGYLSKLNNVIPELYQEAYNRYQDEGTNLETQLGILQQQDQTEYGRHRDDVSDYKDFLNYYNTKYQNERDFDYNQFLQEWDEWNTNRNYGYTKDKDNRDYAFEQDQFNYQKDKDAQDYALEQAQLAETERSNRASESINAQELADNEAAAAAEAEATNKIDTNAMSELARSMYEKTDSDGQRIYSDSQIANELFSIYGDKDNFYDIAEKYTLPGGTNLADAIYAMLQQ